MVMSNDEVENRKLDMFSGAWIRIMFEFHAIPVEISPESHSEPLFNPKSYLCLAAPHENDKLEQMSV